MATFDDIWSKTKETYGNSRINFEEENPLDDCKTLIGRLVKSISLEQFKRIPTKNHEKLLNRYKLNDFIKERILYDYQNRYKEVVEEVNEYVNIYVPHVPFLSLNADVLTLFLSSVLTYRWDQNWSSGFLSKYCLGQNDELLVHKLTVLYNIFKNYQKDIQYYNVKFSVLPWIRHFPALFNRKLSEEEKINNALYNYALPRYPEQVLSQKYPLKLYYDEIREKKLYDNVESIEHFQNHTRNVAISVTGTACATKTTTLNFINNFINNYLELNAIDETCTIYKAGQMGSFQNKDIEQGRAMCYQGVMINVAYDYKYAIIDRSPYDNLIWRIIMALVPSYGTEEFETNLYNAFDTIWSISMMNAISLDPIIIFVDLNEEENRKRMLKRNTGADNWRYSLDGYVEVQNIIYYMVGRMVKSPIFDMSEIINNPKKSSQLWQKIVTMIYTKYSNNSPKPKMPIVKFKMPPIENPIDYTEAEKLGLLK